MSITTASPPPDNPGRPHPDRPETWPSFRPLILAHDVGRSRDHSTAVVGGGSPFNPEVLGILDIRELPQGLYGSARASAVAAVDRHYNNNCLIVVDLSNDASYGEDIFNTFGPRVIGLHITANGNGMEFERRVVGQNVMPVYTIGRTYLIEHFHNLAATRMVRQVKGPDSVRAYAQLANLQCERGETHTIYKTLPGQHDDLGISCCMLGWAYRHPHMGSWITRGFAHRQPRPQPRSIGGLGWT